jgi:hypothetical protein
MTRQLPPVSASVAYFLALPRFPSVSYSKSVGVPLRVFRVFRGSLRFQVSAFSFQLCFLKFQFTIRKEG